jgi:membrane protease YdiL (CAAX protease family)
VQYTEIEPTPPPPERPELPRGADPRWPAWYAWVGFLVAFILTFVVVGIVAAATGASTDEENPTFTVIATFLQGLVFIGTAVLFASFVRRPRPEHFGLRRTRFWPAVGWAAAVLGAFWLASSILVAIFGEPPEQEIAEEIKSEDAALAVIGYVGLTCLIAPLAEEVFFRGLLFPVLRARVGVAWGVLVTGALFSVVHALGSPVEALIVLFVLGSGLCLLYLRTGSLLPCIGLHALNNAISFAATKEMEWPVALLTVVGSVIVTVGIGLAFVRSRADVAAA